MRKILTAVFVANLVLIIVTTVLMPARVAIHFGPGGVPDSWAPRMINAIIFLAISAFSYLLTYIVPCVTRKTPPSLLSLPNRNYWTRPENRPTLEKKIGSLMAMLGIAMILLFAYVEILVTGAHSGKVVQLNEQLFYIGFFAFVFFVIIWLIILSTSLRIPKKPD